MKRKEREMVSILQQQLFFVDGGIQFEAHVWGIDAGGGDVCIDDKKREKSIENNK